MAHEIESMAFNSQEGKPWHGLGVDVNGFMTMREALEKGGLDWLVEKKAIYNESGEVIPNYWSNTRVTDNKSLGIVGDRYQVLQNIDALDFLDTLVGAGQAIYDTVASLKNGRRIFAAVKVPNDRVNATDRIEKYLLVTNSHDGSSPIQVLATDIRVVCNNTLTAALKGTQNCFSVRHTTNLQSKMHEAERILEKSLKYFQKFEETLDIMKDKSFSESQLKETVAKVYGFEIPAEQRLTIADIIAGGCVADAEELSTRQKNIMKDIVELSYTGIGTDLDGVKGTAYGAYNAITEYLDHYSTNRVHGSRDLADVKVDAIHYGSVAEKRQKAFDVIQEMALIAA